MYFIGDGWLQAFTAGAFVLSGSINDDNRARQTGSQILNSLISASIPIQVLKRATGREDPNRASRYRGNWRPFNKNYINDVSAYDAVPSGHMMAATSTLTVIDSNYPEYQTIVRPVGLTLLSLLGFQMVNNGVHWISDYPLGIAIGYVFGRVASAQGKTSSEGHKISDWSILPIYSNDHEHQIFGTAFSMSY
jgi:hypothetical protein